MKHLRFIALAALVALPLTACSDDKKEPTGPVTGTITGTVTVEGAPQDGVSINLVGPTSGSATTSLAGTFEFTNVEAGSYAVLIEDSPTDDVIYAGLSKNVTITTQGQVVTVDFAGSYIRTSTISGNVTADGEGLAGVPVTLAGPEGDKNAVTDGSGHYSVSGLRAGDYTITIDPPEEYVFEQTSLNVSVAVGSLTEASFFGERGVQEVTASLVISKVTKNDGTLVDPDNITGQINVTVQIDPGENKLTRVCVLLDGTEVRNGCQALSVGVAEEMLQAGIFEVTFSIFTDRFDAETGGPAYGNGAHELSARLELEGAEQGSIATTEMVLTFKNTDTVTAVLTPEFNQSGGGQWWLGGVQSVEIFPTLFSGKVLESVTVQWYFDDGEGGWTETYSVDGPFPATALFDPSSIEDDWDGTDWDFTTDASLASYVKVVSGTYADGSLKTYNKMAVIGDTDETMSNFDFEGPDMDAIDFYLTEQYEGTTGGETSTQCCSNNWVGPDYMPADGLSDDPEDAGIGVDMIQFMVYEDYDTDDEVLVGTVAEDGTMADAGLSQSLTNSAWTLCVEAVDFFGNASSTCKDDGPNGYNPGSDFGYDDTAPTNQKVNDQPPEQTVYNTLSTTDEGGLSVAASEDRSGFSAVPFHGYIQWWDSEDMEYLVAEVTSKGAFVSAVNFPQTIPSCTGAVDPDPAVGNVCYPDLGSLDGSYYVTGSMMNQAGILSGDVVEGWVFNDQTLPTVGIVDIPSRMYEGDPATFTAEVEDALHLGTTNFTFELPDILDFYLPLGDPVVNQDGDLDLWDDNFPLEEVASFTVDPMILGVQLYSAGDAAEEWASVQAIHTDGAGNPSAPGVEGIDASRVDDPTDYVLDDIDSFEITNGAFTLCNRDDADDCDDAGGDDTEVEIEIVATGETGVFDNPFGQGELYLYIRTGAGATPAGGDPVYLVAVLNANSALTNDDGTTRTYTWTYTLTAEDVADFSGQIYLHVMGVNDATYTGLLTPDGNGNITVEDIS